MRHSKTWYLGYCHPTIISGWVPGSPAKMVQHLLLDRIDHHVPRGKSKGMAGKRHGIWVQHDIWWFPEIGLSPVIIHDQRSFHEINHFSGTPMTMETSVYIYIYIYKQIIIDRQIDRQIDRYINIYVCLYIYISMKLPMFSQVSRSCWTMAEFPASPLSEEIAK